MIKFTSLKYENTEFIFFQSKLHISKRMIIQKYIFSEMTNNFSPLNKTAKLTINTRSYQQPLSSHVERCDGGVSEHKQLVIGPPEEGPPDAEITC